MKRMILSALVAISALAANAQHEYFHKYADMEGVTSVYVSKTMFRFMKGLPIEVDDVDMSTIISKLDGLYILTTDRPEIKEALRKETEFITKNENFECIKSKQKTKESVTRKEVNGYEEIVRIKEDGQKMAVYMKEEEDARTEYVMIVDSPEDEYVIMIFTGELQPRDVQGLIRVE